MADQDGLIQQFSAVSGTDADRAKFFLESAAWDLSAALSSFYEAGDSDQVSSAAAPAQPAPAAGPDKAKPTSGFPVDDDDDEDEFFDGDDDGEEQAFYAGGSQHSGQQVLGPPKKKDVVAQLFKAAKEHGAQVVTSEAGGSSASQRATFKGTSYRLGETPDDSEVIADNSSSQEGSPVHVQLQMWRTGFTVDDGPLREYQVPENQKFLSDIKKGSIPRELLTSFNGREVVIDMADRHTEDHAPARPKLKAFTGSGHSLGSPAPSVVGQVHHAGPGGSTNKPPVATGDPAEHEKRAKDQLALDSSKPTTSVQVRLGDGSRLVIRANHTHTVADLRTYVATARPQYLGQDFALMTTFPHAELADVAATIASANLLNAAIVVKNK